MQVQMRMKSGGAGRGFPHTPAQRYHEQPLGDVANLYAFAKLADRPRFATWCEKLGMREAGSERA